MSDEDQAVDNTEVDETEGVESEPNDELVEAGKKLKQFQEKYPDIDLDEMPAAFTQTRQEVSELKKELEALRDTPNKDMSPEDAEREQALRKMFTDPLAKRIIHEEILEPQLSKYQSQTREELEVEKTLEGLERTYDGSDGRPKFDRVQVLEYATENKIPVHKLELAYKDINEKELDEWKIKNVQDRKTSSTYSERGSGGERVPKETEPAKSWEETRKRAEDLLNG